MRNGIGHIDICELVAVIKCAVSDPLQSVRKIDILKILTCIECIILDLCDRIGQDDRLDYVAVNKA